MNNKKEQIPATKAIAEIKEQVQLDRWKKDVENGYYMKDPDYYLRQQFQKFIYRLNQPFLRIDQSA